MQNLSAIAKSVRTTVSKRSPEILTALGITGMLTTTVLAVKATPKACKLIEEERNNRGTDEPITKREIVKLVWKYYIPATITGTTSVACLICANSVNAKRNAALATAYKLSETALLEYKEKVIETVGEKKEQVIRDKVAEERVKQNPVVNNEIIITGNGNARFFDVISGRRFTSDIEKLRKIENQLNKRMYGEMYISLNEFYDEIGLEHTLTGDQLGWNIDRGLIDLEFSAQIDDDGVPCIVINYGVAPKYDFARLV